MNNNLSKINQCVMKDNKKCPFESYELNDKLSLEQRLDKKELLDFYSNGSNLNQKTLKQLEKIEERFLISINAKEQNIKECMSALNFSRNNLRLIIEYLELSKNYLYVYSAILKNKNKNYYYDEKGYSNIRFNIEILNEKIKIFKYARNNMRNVDYRKILNNTIYTEKNEELKEQLIRLSCIINDFVIFDCYQIKLQLEIHELCNEIVDEMLKSETDNVDYAYFKAYNLQNIKVFRKVHTKLQDIESDLKTRIKAEFFNKSYKN